MAKKFVQNLCSDQVGRIADHCKVDAITSFRPKDDVRCIGFHLAKSRLARNPVIQFNRTSQQIGGEQLMVMLSMIRFCESTSTYP